MFKRFQDLETFNGMPAMPEDLYNEIVGMAVEMTKKLKKTHPVGKGEVTEDGTLRVLSFEGADDDTTMVVCKEKQIVIAFSRQCLSNMCPARFYLPVPVADKSGYVTTRKLPCWCVEQAFQGLKALLHMDVEGSNAKETVKAIFTAESVMDTKKLGKNMTGFDKERWREAALLLEACILAALEHKETYDRYFGFVYAMVELLFEGLRPQEMRVLIAECNDDLLYGVNRFAREFVEALKRAERRGLGLEEAVEEAKVSPIKGDAPGGQNELGRMLSKLFNAFYGKSHAEFLAAVFPAERGVKRQRGDEGRSLTCPW